MPKTKPFDLILLGGSGDVVMRKLLPALYRRRAAAGRSALHRPFSQWRARSSS